MVMFAANQHPDGRRKDMVINAKDTGWFVWNMATYSLREAVNLSSMALAAGEDEFDHADVYKVACIDAPVCRVAEAPAHSECRFIATHHLPEDTPGGFVDVVYDRMMRIHVRDEMIDAQGKLDIPKIEPIARMGCYDYTVVRDVFEMRIPGTSQAEADGLEGKS